MSFNYLSAHMLGVTPPAFRERLASKRLAKQGKHTIMKTKSREGAQKRLLRKQNFGLGPVFRDSVMDTISLEVRQTRVQDPAEGLCKLLKCLSPISKIKTGTIVRIL